MLPGRSLLGSRCARIGVTAALLVLPVRADHPKDFMTALDGMRTHNLAVVDKTFLRSASGRGADRLLSLYELGGFYHLGGESKKSMDFFNTADQVAHDYEGTAVVSAGQAAQTAGATLLNDSLLRFEGYGYDKVMSHTLNAMNYLAVGDLEGARVEVRKAEEYQKLERDRHQKEVQKAQARQPGAENARVDNPAVQAAYGPMFDFARKVRNSFENAFTYYLASQIFLAQGEEGLNDAMVEIRRAFELAPEAPAVRDAYLEIARAQGGTALDQAKADLRVAEGATAADPRATGEVVVCYEVGLVPRLEEVKINLFAINRLYSLAFPIYRNLGPSQGPLTIAPPPPARIAVTSTIVDTRALAVKSLQERMPGILTRGLLGAIARGEMQKKAEKNYGFFGGLVAMAASAAVTNADLRSWLSLPAEVQVAKCNLAPGPSTLTLTGPGWVEVVPLDIAPGSHTFLMVRAFPGYRRIVTRTFAPEGAGVPSMVPAAPAAALIDPPAAPVSQ